PIDRWYPQAGDREHAGTVVGGGRVANVDLARRRLQDPVCGELQHHATSVEHEDLVARCSRPAVTLGQLVHLPGPFHGQTRGRMSASGITSGSVAPGGCHSSRSRSIAGNAASGVQISPARPSISTIQYQGTPYSWYSRRFVKRSERWVEGLNTSIASSSVWMRL